MTYFRDYDVLWFFEVFILAVPAFENLGDELINVLARASKLSFLLCCLESYASFRLIKENTFTHSPVPSTTPLSVLKYIAKSFPSLFAS